MRESGAEANMIARGNWRMASGCNGEKRALDLKGVMTSIVSVSSTLPWTWAQPAHRAARLKVSDPWIFSLATHTATAAPSDLRPPRLPATSPKSPQPDRGVTADSVIQPVNEAAAALYPWTSVSTRQQPF